MKPAQRIFVGFLLILMVVFYFFRLQSVSRLNIPEGKKITLKGRITQQPYLKDSYQIIYLGPVFLQTDRFPGYFYGDRLVVTGRFEERVINPFETRYSAYFPDIQRVEDNESKDFLFTFKGSLYNFRGRLEKVIAEVLPEPQASLLIGILLGVKKEMPENFLNNLRKTGTLHIIVASGYNLSVIAGFLVSFLVYLMSRKKALLIAFLGVFLYTLMVGAEPPVVRAAIMAGLTYTAQYLGRMRDGLITLIITAIIMLLLSPLILFDIGFQLSLMATVGILLIQPLLKEIRFLRLPLIGDDLATTLAAQIGVMPVILVNFGNLSWLSPLINALVLPLIPLLMNLGGAVVLFGLVSKLLAQVLSWLLWLPLSYFVKLIEFFGGWGWINFDIERLSFWWALGYYFVLGVVLYWRWQKKWKLTEPRLF